MPQIKQFSPDLQPKKFSLIFLVSILLLFVFLLPGILNSLHQPKPEPAEVVEAKTLEARRLYFVNMVRNLFRKLPAETEIELELGKQSNRVILTGAVVQVALPEGPPGTDQVFLDFFDGNIVACRFADQREISRLYLVDKVKSLVWEVYTADTDEWSPIHLVGGTSGRPSRIRLKYQVGEGQEQVETFEIASGIYSRAPLPKITLR